MIKIKSYKKISVIGFFAALFILCALSLLPAHIYAASQVQTTSSGLNSKVAPGEFLPLSVRLANFGSNSRVDVAIVYKIIDEGGKIIYTSQETVAVQTTANFIKTIQIPGGTAPGHYIASSSIVYQGQVTPAISEFPFTIEPKIFGLFQSDFYRYAGITLAVAIIAAITGRLWLRRRRTMRLTPVDYSDIPGDSRIFYELISDTVMGMRQQVGQQAFDIVSHIEGIKIDEKTGRVLTLTKKPSLVVAELVSEYENVLGKKVSFTFRNA